MASGYQLEETSSQVQCNLGSPLLGLGCFTIVGLTRLARALLVSIAHIPYNGRDGCWCTGFICTQPDELCRCVWVCTSLMICLDIYIYIYIPRSH